MLGLTACTSMPFGGGASAEKFQQSYLQQNLIKGKTTKADIVAKYGEPVSKSVHASGRETWVYRSSKSNSAIESLSSSSSTVNTGLGIIKNRLMAAIPGGGLGEVGAMVNSAKHDAVNAAMTTGQSDKAASLVISFNAKGAIESYMLGL
ncbi:hypothetical protein F907_00861 [Acinetobacter colistiniresistens]|nr:hypothetical protein F907_00861 [Acinetobacter colistiniresistens]